MKRWRRASGPRAATIPTPPPSRLRFGAVPGGVAPGRCHVCGRLSEHVALTIDVESGSPIVLLSCSCGSLFFPEAVAPDYEVIEDERAFLMRADQAESIDASARPLFLSPAFEHHSVVDVGCGSGFAADFVRFLGRPCDAFDPSTSAQVSSVRLGIPIDHRWATPATVHVPSPRLVYSSEVIEHVNRPVDFLENLRAIAGPDGHVIVTTPDAEAVRADVPEINVLAILGPGQHLFLCSPASLRWLAEQAGFPWAHVLRTGDRLFLVAGPHEVPIEDVFPRERYFEYLAHRLVATDRGEEELRVRTFGSRWFKELVHAGRYPEALTVLDTIRTTYARLGVDLDDPEAAVRWIGSNSDGWLPRADRCPMNVPVILFLMGTLAITTLQDGRRARRYFEAATAASELYEPVIDGSRLQAFDLETQAVRTWARESIVRHGL